MFRLDIDEGIARLTLDRPQARNAIPAAGWRALETVLAEVEASAARLLVVAGAGGAFCAGADLKDFPAFASNEGRRAAFRTEMRSAIERLAGLAIPSVAHVDGPCYGAGVALALACDVRVAGPRARFAITPAKIGIAYPQEDVHRLVRLVGAGQAARLLFTAREIDGAEALRIGLADVENIDGLAEAILAADPVSVATLKEAIRRAAAGISSDPAMDARFDELIGGEALGRRLEALGRK